MPALERLLRRVRCADASRSCAFPPFAPQGEWTEYDEKAGESVSIMELQHEFRVHREK